jgi:hypothetical protein
MTNSSSISISSNEAQKINIGKMSKGSSALIDQLIIPPSKKKYTSKTIVESSPSGYVPLITLAEVVISGLETCGILISTGYQI